MILFPNAKINLGLHVIAERQDGFHDIETVLFPVDLCDALELIPSADGKTTFMASGVPVPGKAEENLCLKALEVFYTHPHTRALILAQGRGMNIHLHKVIPPGSGLGGGSSDGAFTLMVLNELYGLNLTDEVLMEMASRLGSDCSFFIRNQPALATGKGDILEPVALNLSAYRIELAFPDVHVSTKEAYSLVRPRKPMRCIREIILQPVETWKDILVNDFEEPVFKMHPEIHATREQFYVRGALYASMSGSGSAVYGIFSG
jgi:4-diphosphocytidyl-2-C-methyl-D-erythritol kinase